jgi:hypothetical protein
MGLKKLVKKVTKSVTNPVSSIKSITNITKKIDPLGIGAGGLKEGALGGLLKKGAVNENTAVPELSPIEKLALTEEEKRKALGLQQQGQINEFANTMEGEVANYRKRLAQNLADTSQQTFQQATPGLLEDLNARGLFTSQTARDQETNRALQELATQQNNILSDYDTQQFGNIQDLRGTALSALLGGDQSALDSALALRKADIQRSFDVADQNAQNNLAMMLARRQSRDQLTSSLIGGGGMGIAALLCFDGETDIKMADGLTKKINEVAIGDTTAGGIVISRRESFTQNGTRYNHNGTIVTGSHAVFEDGIWKRIENSSNATPIEGSGIVYSLVTTGHRIYVGDNIYGDEFEVDDYYKHQERVNNETLQQLNTLVGSVA